MKKKTILSLLLVIILMGCTALTASDEMPEPDGDALWGYITEVSPYQSWGFWSDHQGMQAGRAPHGPQHKVFVNQAGLMSSGAPAQYGTIEVKENYGNDNILKAITVMYKVRGYNPADGDWFWAKYSPTGKTLKQGKLDGCIGCHGTRAANDFILVHEL